MATLVACLAVMTFAGCSNDDENGSNGLSTSVVSGVLEVKVDNGSAYDDLIDKVRMAVYP